MGARRRGNVTGQEKGQRIWLPYWSARADHQADPFFWYPELLQAELIVHIRGSPRVAAAFLRRTRHCVLCGSQLCDSWEFVEAAQILGVEIRQRIDHHVSYKPEETIPVCQSCHSHIHRGEEVPEVFRPPARQLWWHCESCEAGYQTEKLTHLISAKTVGSGRGRCQGRGLTTLSLDCGYLTLREGILVRREAGFGSLIFGILIGIGGFFLYNFQAVCFITCFRPYETLGLMVIGFGMALFVLGIALIAMARTRAT